MTRAAYPRANTTARGYGWDHQQTRARKLAVLQDGAPCRRCGRVMIHPKRCPSGPCFFCTLDLGHATALALGGHGPRELEHCRCNRSAGSKLGNHLRARRRQPVTSRRW